VTLVSDGGEDTLIGGPNDDFLEGGSFEGTTLDGGGYQRIRRAGVDDEAFRK
jgi:hypothetical protein